MNKEEFAYLAMAMRTYYPREKNLLPNDQAMDLWYDQLKDIPKNVAMVALKKWVSTHEWSPAISDLREAAASVSRGDVPEWGEGWEKVLSAIRMYGRERPKSALASMDPITAKCVEQIGWWNLCVSTNTANDRANFRMIYETLAKREKEKQQMSLPLQEAIERLRVEHSNVKYYIGGKTEC